MTSNRILLGRHGETEWNAVGRRQGQLDSPLTELGRRHAERIASILDGERFDMICASPLGRAFDTATVIADHRGIPVTVFDDLAELHHGIFAGLSNSQIDEQFPGALSERSQHKYTWRFPQGESYADLDLRSAAALQAIAAAGSTQPLIISHEMISRMLLRNLLQLNPDHALAFDLPHGAILDVRPHEVERARWLNSSAAEPLPGPISGRP